MLYGSDDEIVTYTVYDRRSSGKSYIADTSDYGPVYDVVNDDNGNLTIQRVKETYDKYATSAYSELLPYSTSDDTKLYTAKTKRGIQESTKRHDARSVGIDWDKVKSVSGDTYNIKDFIKSHGFTWDRDKKRWKK